jgi:hypothetical protein
MINSVRNTVLAVLNKNNYGYISPSDFNQYALQAQLELYEDYFAEYNKQQNLQNARQSGTDYADIEKPTAEVIEGFLVDEFLVPKVYGTKINNTFQVPSEITTGSDFYMINRIITYTSKKATGTNTGTIASYKLVNSAANFSTISVGDIVINSTDFTSAIVVAIDNATTLSISQDIFTAAGKSYSIYDKTKYSEADKVTNGKIMSLNASLLTAPDDLFPVYTLVDSIITAYPETLVGYGTLRCMYFRYPKKPKWTYISLSGGEPVFDPSGIGYQDFELPQEDEYKLACKILEYCGISIRETQVVQYAMAERQKQSM